MQTTPLDLTLAELETLPSREKIRERVTELEQRALVRHADDVYRFLRYIARPCLAGGDSPVFAEEFKAYAERFKRLWRRVK